MFVIAVAGVVANNKGGNDGVSCMSVVCIFVIGAGAGAGAGAGGSSDIAAAFPF